MMGDSESISPRNGSSAPEKRKHDDLTPQPRAKRNRYISIACNECKRRKIKCNGQNPCQRCGNLALECMYAPNCCNSFKESEEFKQMDAHISSLQEQVDQLFANLSTLRTQVDTPSNNVGTSYGSQEHGGSMSMSQSSTYITSPATHNRSQSQTRHPQFHGPTSSQFGLGIAKSSLQTMGLFPPGGVDEDIGTQGQTPAGSPPLASSTPLKPILHASKDPIWSLSKEEATRLVNMWHEEMGMMYPFLNHEKIVEYTKMLFTFMDAANRAGLMRGEKPGADAIMDEQTTVLKLILATALVIEGYGKSELGHKMFQNVQTVVETTLLAPVTLRGIHMLMLTGMYHFQLERSDESLAWRICGLAARQCLEFGLHRRETYNLIFEDEEERSCAIRTFWSVYCLDRRWSFGTGLGLALQDSDIDPQLPKPDNSTPYFTLMVAYSHIGSKVWKSVSNFDSTQNNISNEDIGYLDYQILQWHQTVPESLKYAHPDSGRKAQPSTRGVARLRVALYLRANQMRIVIYRPVLHTATSIMENMEHAQTVVNIAKDSIRVLTHTNLTSDIYKTQQAMFNYFLISALAVLFLAVSHAPAQFSSQCRDEFYMALDLVRGLSADSYVSQRLWRTIRGLKEIVPKLGLNIGNISADDAHSTAAVAMAGLAGHQVDEMAIFSNGREGRPGQNTSPNGMANDLTNLFEAAGSYPSMLANGFGMSGSDMATGDLMPTLFGHEDELSRVLKDLF